MLTFTAQQRNYTLRIMCAEQIHQGTDNGTGIIFQYVQHDFQHITGITAIQKAENRITERIVHNAVQFLAIQETAAGTIAFLVGSIFPDLTEQ